jgi:hypothetical protein
MDSQFSQLTRSFSDNYIQFKVTGNARYKQGYEAAQQGLDTILDQLQTKVNSEKQQIGEFYKSGVEQKLSDLSQRNRFLERGLLTEQDEIVAAHMRTPTSTIQVIAPPIQTWQYIALGVLGATAIGLSVL